MTTPDATDGLQDGSGEHIRCYIVDLHPFRVVDQAGREHRPDSNTGPVSTTNRNH